MIVLLSPSKTLDFSVAEPERYTFPDLLGQSEILVRILQGMTLPLFKKQMGVNDRLARLNYDRYQGFSLPFTPQNAKSAIAVFKGDVYTGLSAGAFSAFDLEYAQEHLRILSGLYGLLRPLDLIQPYRLEMGTNLVTSRGKNLYAFWGKRITEELKRLLVCSGPFVINLASVEYSKAVHFSHLSATVVTPVFKEKKGNSYRSLMVYTKRARGMMAAYIIRNRLKTPEKIKDFREAHYQYEPDLSTKYEWVFVR